MKNQRYKVSCGSIDIRIDINWDEADVDAVFSEVSRMIPTSHQVKGNQTPTSESVHKLLHELFEEFKSDPYNKNETIWQQKGIGFKEANGLMMGNSFIVFDVDLEKTPVEKLPETIILLKSTVSKFVSKYVRYYKNETKLNSGIGMIMAQH
jgi:hypothetical protein